VFERGTHQVLSGGISDVAVRLIGRDAAVVTGLTNASGTYAGTPYTAQIRFTDTFERHGTNWRAVRSHASSVSK
jgi:ketosteroid isomerase-like protein